MTGFESKRKVAQAKLDDETDRLTIVYQQGFADGKLSAQRKPLTDKELNLIGAKWHYNLLSKDDKAELFAFVRAAIEAARGIGDKT